MSKYEIFSGSYFPVFRLKSIQTFHAFKIMKNGFYCILKALFILNDISIFVLTFSSLGKLAWFKNKVNLQIYDVTAYLKINYSTNIAQYLTK